MAEPRKVPFVTISSFGSAPQTPELNKKRRREDEAVDMTFGKDGGGSVAALGSGGGGGPFGNRKGGDTEVEETKPTVRLSLTLTEPNERTSAEFNYGELVNSTTATTTTTTTTTTQVKLPCATVPKGLTPMLDPSDPFADDDKERREVEELARKFETKYGGASKKKKKDRIQDLVDIGFGYDESDPFIDNSEAYDELVPASLTTKHGGFYINTGTLQFRAASDSEGENGSAENNLFKKAKDGEERAIKKRRKKTEGGLLEDKKPKKNKIPRTGVSALNVHRPEKKKRKKLMKDSIHLANMLRRFTREKEEIRKKNVVAAGLPRPPTTKVPNAGGAALLATQPKAPGSGGGECTMADLSADPAVMSLLGAANNDLLQDMMGDLDFGMLDSPQPSSPVQGENGLLGAGHKAGGGGRLPQGSVMSPPPLPGGLPGPLAKRIEDLRAASKLFDDEGRKKFFTLDMNNILLDIELQVQEQPTEVRSAIYSHLEAFVPCNKEALLKRLKKLSLNIQDDRLRTPLLKLKLAVCSVMPEQIARFNMDCIAKVAKQQSEEGEKNGSEDDDEEKPGKRVMGPRKKFVWDDKLRMLLCSLVRVKLGCYELEGKNSLSLEEYLKAFMETEVKPLWPKGWMQTRILFKESIMIHGHLTGYTAKKKVVQTPKAKPKEAVWVQRSTPSAGSSEPICLDSLDEDSISQALAILGNAAKGLAQGDGPPSPPHPAPSPVATASSKPSSLRPSPGTPVSHHHLLSSQPQQQQKKNSVSVAPHYITTSSSSPSPASRPLPSSPAATAGPRPLHSSPAGPSPSVKASALTHRYSAPGAQKTLRATPPSSSSSSTTTSSPSPLVAKPRPPPTASPLLVPPGAKVLAATPSPAASILKGGKSGAVTSAPRPQGLVPSPAHAGPPKPFPSPGPRLPLQQTPSPAITPTGARPARPQSSFITPMHATLTKPPHSSVPPIVKLTPRTPNPTSCVSSSTSTPISSPLVHSPRSQATPSLRQYTPKSPAAYRPPFSGSPGGGVAKLGPGGYTSAGSQKTIISSSSSSNSNSSTGLSSSAPISKHSGTSASPSTGGQRQRPMGGAPQGSKTPISSSSSVSSQLPQVSVASGSSLLGPATSLPLSYGMLGGMVPVSLPFQFPPLLSMPLGGGGSGSAASSSAAASSTAFSGLAQNLYKSIQSGSQVALPPHLQLAFSDVSQNQGGDSKRKNL